MAKFSDAIKTTLKSYFNAGDQPTEAQFASLIDAIQEGIEEHEHDATGDGDGVGVLDSVTSLSIGMAASGAIFEVAADVAGYYNMALLFNAHATGIPRIQLGKSAAANEGMNLGYFTASNYAAWWIAGDDPTAGTGLILRGGGLVGAGVIPTTRLDVADDNVGYVAQFFNDGNNINRNGIKIQCGPDDQSATFGYYVTLFDGDGGEEGGIRVNSGTVEIFQTSDRSLKANITPTKYGLSDILKLNVVDFNWKRNPTGPKKCGMVAQEVEKVFPDAVGPSTNGKLLALAPTALIPVVIRAIQELDARLEAGGL